MKKVGAPLLLFLIFLSMVPLVLADNHTNSDDESNIDKIEKGYACLEEKASDCSSLTNQEIAYTILSNPDNIFDECVSELEGRKSSNNNWGNVRDTALAVLALEYAGRDTKSSEEWLLENSKTPTDLIWYLEQDSNSKTECHISYDSESYLIAIGENKKIDKNAGSCLGRAQSNFWFEISPSCYSKTFRVECDTDFITTLLYKNKNSATIYVLEGTQSSPAFGTLETSISSKCFGDTTCSYESTAWATLALMQTGHNVEEYIPYLVAMSSTNERYLPEAFIYMVTNYEDYATQLVEKRKLGNYWEAENSAYNKYYDTALALISLGTSTAPQIEESKDWLLFSQPSNGCWQNSIRDTAIVLWALTQKAGKSSGGGGVTLCSEANFFCIPNSECATEDQRGNYFCSSLSTICCATQNLKTCAEYSGTVCASNEECIGNQRNSLDSPSCCTGYCEEPIQETECEANFYICKDSCSDSQESVDYSCNSGQICCRTKTNSSSGLMWIWILLGLIIIVLTAIIWIYRERLKMWWFKRKSKYKKGRGPQGQAQGPRRLPPRPPFPPVGRQMPVRRLPPRPPSTPADKELSDTFDKLRKMSG